MISYALFFLSKQYGTIINSEIDNWNKRHFNDNDQNGTFIPIVGDVRNVELLFKYKVNNSDKDTMEAEDEHRADRDDRNETDFDAVEASAEVDDTKDGKEVYHVKEGDVQDKSLFVDMPVEKDDADEQGRYANKKILPEVEAFQIVGMTEEIPQEEKAEAAYETVECDIGCKVPVFIGAVEYDTDHG